MGKVWGTRNHSPYGRDELNTHNDPWGRSRLVLFGVLCCLIPFPSLAHARSDAITPNPVSGRAVSVDEIIPADVMARAQLIRDELDDLRFEMGKPKNRHFGIIVSDASPHEVFSQALALKQKVDRLVGEMTGEKEPKGTVALPANIRPYHVWKVVDGSLQRLALLKQKLGLKIEESEKLIDASATPNEVFLTIGLANRQVNILLEHPFAPRDVYQEVTLATHYAARLLRQFSDSQQFPQAPELERGRRPADVYTRLIDCQTRLFSIANRSSLSILKIEIPNTPLEHIQPSDVFDMASLLVSELAHFNGKLKNPYTPKPMKDPGIEFPSHVYQQAGVLLAQLRELELQVRANPEWLGR